MPKKIDVNISTLIDLKSELFKKQEESKNRKEANVAGVFYVKNPDKKPFMVDKDALERKTAESKARKDKIVKLEKEIKEEENQMRKSREALEAKAKLYDRLSKGRTEEGKEHFLVNFDQKPAKKSRSPSPDLVEIGPSAGPSFRFDSQPTIANGDEEWVEYTDSLGRTRSCMRKDLSKFIAADKRLQGEENKNLLHMKERASVARELMTDDMRREEQRLQWERDAMMGDAEKGASGPVHYQHVLRDEAWDHGVAYFQFSKDEITRQEQMKGIDAMRKQTIDSRKRNAQLQEKRKRQLEERLNKVRERKKLKAEDNNEDAAESIVPSDDEEGPNPEDIPLPPEMITEHERKRQEAAAKEKARASHVRPWDQGKKVSQDEWIEDRRKERPSEFSPPTGYKY